MDEPAPTTSRLEEPDPAHRPARLALYLGGGLVAVGALVLYIGYNGAATNALVPAQIPYVISGGLLGAALMVLGAITISVHVILRVQADFRTEMGGMRESMENLADLMARQAFAGGAPAGAVPSANGTVVVARGSSSYHRAECRLVERAEHTKPIPRDEAQRTGLVPCRICKP